MPYLRETITNFARMAHHGDTNRLPERAIDPQTRVSAVKTAWILLLPSMLVGACTGTQAGNVLVITDVTVIPMDGTPPIPGATVIVRGDTIDVIAIGLSAPRGARVVDGRGKYLIPGLFEMHAHTSKTRASALGLYIANGVTTIRDVGGDHEELLGWRSEVRAGTRVGPRMLIAGPYLESADNVERMRNTPPDEMVEPVERTRIPVGSPERARFVVDSLAKLELDFLKIRTVQDRATYSALNAAAEAHGIPLVGHTFGITPDLMLDAGQDGIDHFLYPTLDDLALDDRMALWAQFAERGVAIVPTLFVTEGAARLSPDSLQAFMDDSLGQIDPRRRYVSRFLELDWREQMLEQLDDDRAIYRTIYAATLRNVREMHEAGMRVLTGTDVAVLTVYPGFSLHDELVLFVEDLGMTPMEALESATRKPAEFLGRADSVGSIAPGMVADLLLLDANPLQDIRNTTSIAAVIVRGILYDRQGLDDLLEGVLSAPDQTVNDWPRRRSPN